MRKKEKNKKFKNIHTFNQNIILDYKILYKYKINYQSFSIYVLIF